MSSESYKKQVNIVVKLQIAGVHRWYNCDIDEVKYLQDLHRHVFYIELRKQVTHNDRDIEIIELKTKIEQDLKDQFWDDKYKLCNFKHQSCEQLADYLLERYECQSVTVLEDNENGAEVRIVKN